MANLYPTHSLFSSNKKTNKMDSKLKTIINEPTAQKRISKAIKFALGKNHLGRFKELYQIDKMFYEQVKQKREQLMNINDPEKQVYSAYQYGEELRNLVIEKYFSLSP